MGGGRGRRGAAAAGGCPPHPAFLTTAPSSSWTPRPPWPGALSPLHRQSLAEACQAQVTNGARGPAMGMSPRNGQRSSQHFHWSGAAQCPQTYAWFLEGNRAIPSVPFVPSVPSILSIPGPHAQMLFITGDLISSERGCPGNPMLLGWQCNPKPSQVAG